MGPEHFRRYRILTKLADGGHGAVYHARMTGPADFSKDVALKLLHPHLASESALRHLRAEARLLALVRDSTVVGVDPPIFVNGQWALAMEYAEGASVAMLLKEHERLPPGVAIEIVERVARTLDNVWRQKGEDGRPLQLIHRDIKPANIQISPDGNLRLLDLGIATASCIAEQDTTSSFVGTPGYMAPERLTGVEGPEGDIFSLGILLHEMLVGKRPPIVTDAGRYVERMAKDDPTLRRLLHLATQMFNLDPKARPTAREVEKRAAQIRLVTQGPYLRDWAERAVGAIEVGIADPLCGRVLVEEPGSLELTGMFQREVAREEPSGGRLITTAVLLSLGALLLTVGVGAMGMAGLWGALSWGSGAEPDLPGADTEALALREGAAPEAPSGLVASGASEGRGPDPAADGAVEAPGEPSAMGAEPSAAAEPSAPDSEPSAPDSEPSAPDPKDAPEAGEGAASDPPAERSDGIAAASPAPRQRASPRPRRVVRPDPPPAPAASVVLEDLRLRAIPGGTVITLVMSNDQVRPLHYLQEEAGAEYPAIYLISFRGGASGLPQPLWNLNTPAGSNIEVREHQGNLVIALRLTERARVELSNSGAIWTLTYR